MNKLRHFLYFIICMVINNLCNAQQHDLKLVSKEFLRYGITISLPIDWNYVDGSENMKNKLFKCYYKEANNTTPYNTVAVSISYEVLNTQIQVDTVFNQIEATLKNQVSNRNLINYAGRKIQGCPSKSYKYNFSINEIQLTSISTYFIKQNVLFCFNATVVFDKLENYEKVIEAISQSIQIGNLDPILFPNSYELKKIESRYVNNKYGFEVDFPIGWYYLEDIMNNAVQIKKVNQDTSETISMSVNIQDGYDSKLTSEQYIKSVIKLYRENLLLADKNEQILAKKFSHLKIEAYKAHFVTIANNKKQIVFIYATIKDKKGFLFIATTDENHLLVNEKLFDSTFASMTIK